MRAICLPAFLPLSARGLAPMRAKGQRLHAYSDDSRLRLSRRPITKVVRGT